MPLGLNVYTVNIISLVGLPASLYRYKSKHLLGAAPTIPMGSRLADAIGREKLNALMDACRSGQLVLVREKSLYLDFTGGELIAPSE